MKRYSTPIEELTIEGIDLTECEVYVTFAQGETVYTLSGEDITVEFDGTDTQISVHLTQEQTASFVEDNFVRIQVNWMDNGERNVTDIAYVMVGANLHDEVIVETVGEVDT